MIVASVGGNGGAWAEIDVRRICPTRVQPIGRQTSLGVGVAAVCLARSGQIDEHRCTSAGRRWSSSVRFSIRKTAGPGRSII